MRMLITVVAMGLLCSSSFANSTPAQTNTSPQTEAQPAQSQPTAAAQPNGAKPTGIAKIAAGSVIPVQLTKTVDAKKVKTGDEVEVKVTQDMKAQSGQILLPKDTKIVGHVTEAQARTKDQKESQLGITFDHAVMKEGGNVSLPALIQAVIAPPNQNPDNGNPLSQGVGAQSGSGSRTATPGPAGAGGASPPQAPQASSNQSDASAGNSSNPQITASTQGVIGISNYKLSTPGDVTQGSVVSSEKSNVKLESGTLMLLRVNQ
jgi:hypothetical protein